MMTGNRMGRTMMLAVGLGAAMALLAAPVLAQQPPAPKRDDYDQVLERYLQAARTVAVTPDRSFTRNERRSACTPLTTM